MSNLSLDAYQQNLFYFHSICSIRDLPLVRVIDDLVGLPGPLLLGEPVALVRLVDDADHDVVAASLLAKYLLHVVGLEGGQGGALVFKLGLLRVLAGNVELLLQEGQPGELNDSYKDEFTLEGGGKRLFKPTQQAEP